MKLLKRKVFIKENKKKYLFYKFAKRFIEKKTRNLNDLQIKQIKFIRSYNKKFWLKYRKQPYQYKEVYYKTYLINIK